MSHILGKSILLLGRLLPGTANNSMAYRIRRYFDTNMQVSWTAKDSELIHDKNEFHQLLIDKNVDCVIGFHAVISGKLLRDCPVPYAVVFTGTDVCESSKSAENMDIMTFAMLNARFLIVTTKNIETKVLTLWPNLEKEKLLYIPHGMVTFPAGVSSMKGLEKYQLHPNAIIFVIVTRIEPSRDPLHIIPAFTHWHQMFDLRPTLVIVGPITDSEYGKLFNATIDGCPGVFYVGVKTIHETHRLIADSFALVNCAVKPGTNLHILEAMDLGVPVIARDSDANLEIVEDEQNCLTYSFPEEFVAKAESLIENVERRELIVRGGHQYILNEHNPSVEKQSYASLAAALTKSCIYSKTRDSYQDEDDGARRVRFKLQSARPRHRSLESAAVDSVSSVDKCTVEETPEDTVTTSRHSVIERRVSVSPTASAKHINWPKETSSISSSEFVDSWMSVELTEENDQLDATASGSTVDLTLLSLELVDQPDDSCNGSSDDKVEKTSKEDLSLPGNSDVDNADVAQSSPPSSSTSKNSSEPRKAPLRKVKSTSRERPSSNGDHVTTAHRASSNSRNRQATTSKSSVIDTPDVGATTRPTISRSPSNVSIATGASKMKKSTKQKTNKTRK